MLKVRCIKSHSVELSPLNTGHVKQIEHELQQTKCLWHCYILFKSTAKFVKKWEQKLLLVHNTVILNEGQGHSNQYQNVEFSILYHHTHLEQNWFVNVQTQANVTFLF